VKLLVVADPRVEKFKILKKAVKKLEKDGIKEALARNGIKPVDEAVVMLKIIIASLFFRLELSYFVEELKNRKKLRKLLNLSGVDSCSRYQRFVRFRGKVRRRVIQKGYRADYKLLVR